ncbi:MAG: HD domain-containing phosphohydrolase [Myxococcaceae bacterium]
MRLFTAIFLLMLAVALVSTGLVGLLVLSDTRELLTRDAQELAAERVSQVSLKATAALDAPVRATTALSRVPGFLSLPSPEQRAHLAAVLTERRDLTALTVFSARGERLPGLQAFAVKDLPPTEVAEHEARARALIGPGPEAVRWSRATLLPDRPSSLTFVFPLGDPARGYVAAELSLAALGRALEAEHVGSTGFAYVVDVRGRLLAGAPERARPGDDLSSRPAVAPAVRMLKEAPEREVTWVGNFGEGDGRVVAASAIIPGPGWAVVSEQPLDAAYTQVRLMQRRIGLGLVAAIGVALMLALVFSRGLTRPLKGFTRSALEIARGKFGTQVQVETRNELGELAKTFNYMSQQLLAYDKENRGLYESLERGYLETILALANSIDSKDAYTRGHSQRVGDMAAEIGREMGLTDREVKQLRYGGILHDIGKIGIAENILCKQTQLTTDEMSVMREHPSIGASIVGPVSFLGTARDAVRSHHEKWNGTGYPEGLKGQAIPLIARVVACADTWDACTSTRPYQRAMGTQAAMEVMNRLRGVSLDPDVVDALARVLEKKGAFAETSPSPRAVPLAS